jgi:hypothetical protein
MAPQVLIGRSEARQRGDEFDGLGAEAAFDDGEAALENRHGFGVAMLFDVDSAERGEKRADPRVRRAERLFVERDAFAPGVLCLGEFAGALERYRLRSQFGPLRCRIGGQGESGERNRNSGADQR